MANSINFGVSPYRTIMSVNRVNSLLSDNMERLSTGLRVNKAADDPAGLAVAIQLTKRDNSASQALRNTAQGTSIIQTAEGAMGEIGNILTSTGEIVTWRSLLRPCAVSELLIWLCLVICITNSEEERESA